MSKKSRICCESTDPIQGSQIPKIGKRGFRARKAPISDRPRKGCFESKNPHFSTGYHKENGDFWTQSAHFWGDRKWELFDPETLFSRFGDFDPCRGSADSQQKTDSDTFLTLFSGPLGLFRHSCNRKPSFCLEAALMCRIIHTPLHAKCLLMMTRRSEPRADEKAGHQTWARLDPQIRGRILYTPTPPTPPPLKIPS